RPDEMIAGATRIAEADGGAVQDDAIYPPPKEVVLRVDDHGAQRAIRLLLDRDVERDAVLERRDLASPDEWAEARHVNRRRVRGPVDDAGRLDPVTLHRAGGAVHAPSKLPQAIRQNDRGIAARTLHRHVEAGDIRTPLRAPPIDRQSAADKGTQRLLGSTDTHQNVTRDPDCLGGCRSSRIQD